MPLTQEELQAIVKQSTDLAVRAAADAVAVQMKGVTDSQAEFAKNLKILSDTMAADKKADADAAAAAGKEKKDVAKPGGEPKYLTAEDVTKLLADQRAKDQASANVTAARQRVIDAKLAKVPKEFLAGAPDTEDAAQLNAWADGVIKRVNEVIPGSAGDLGGANRDGGTAAGKGGAAASPALAANGALTTGQAKFAGGIAAEVAALKGAKA